PSTPAGQWSRPMAVLCPQICRWMADARIRQMLDLVGATVSYRHPSANASVLFMAQLAGQMAR
ncbi:MAG: hypothetical protein ACXWKP_32995, partial [Bradyrhizobium sp.]